MTAIEMRRSLLQEIDTILDNEELVKKMLMSLRRIKQAAQAKAEADREPTKEEILAGIKAGLQEIKAAREGGYQLRDIKELFPYTMEELNTRIDRAEEDIAAGRLLTSEQMFSEVDAFVGKLCK